MEYNQEDTNLTVIETIENNSHGSYTHGPSRIKQLVEDDKGNRFIITKDCGGGGCLILLIIIPLCLTLLI